MFKYNYSNYLQLEINTESKIGRVLFDCSHIADITPSTVILFHPEIFKSIDEDAINKSGLKFNFPEPSHKFLSCEKIDFQEMIHLINVFRRSISG